MRGLTGCGVLMLCCVLAAGCGDGRETHFDEGTIVATHTENVRSWLQGVAQSGQLDSGADIMRDEIAGMKEEGVESADALLVDFEQLMQARGAAALKAKAADMLKKLPPESAAPAETTP